jgi:hypothetical protein
MEISETKAADRLQRERRRFDAIRELISTVTKVCPDAALCKLRELHGQSFPRRATIGGAIPLLRIV